MMQVSKVMEYSVLIAELRAQERLCYIIIGEFGDAISNEVKDKLRYKASQIHENWTAIEQKIKKQV